VLVVKKQGKVLKDNLEKPLNHQDVFNDFLKENNWLNIDGRGGGNGHGQMSGEFKTINDVFKHLEKNNIDPGSSEGKRLIDKFNQSQK
jgi:hypothetical protein